MLTKMKTAIAGIATAAMVGAGTLAAVPAEAAPVYPNYVQDVAFHDGGPGGPQGDRDDWQRRGHRGHNGGNWVVPLIGGLIIGGLAAQAAQGAGGGGHDAYCHQRFQSYNSYTGRYTGYDGLQHRC